MFSKFQKVSNPIPVRQPFDITSLKGLDTPYALVDI